MMSKTRKIERGAGPVATITADDPDSLLAPLQLTGVLGVKKKTLEKWRTQGGHIPFVKVGGLVRYRKKDVLAYLADRTRLSTSEQ